MYLESLRVLPVCQIVALVVLVEAIQDLRTVAIDVVPQPFRILEHVGLVVDEYPPLCAETRHLEISHSSRDNDDLCGVDIGLDPLGYDCSNLRWTNNGSSWSSFWALTPFCVATVVRVHLIVASHSLHLILDGLGVSHLVHLHAYSFELRVHFLIVIQGAFDASKRWSSKRWHRYILDNCLFIAGIIPMFRWLLAIVLGILPFCSDEVIDHLEYLRSKFSVIA